MNARGCLILVSIVLAFVVLRIFLGCFFAVYQTEQVIITQFGKPVGEPITDSGLHFKLPLVQEINRIPQGRLASGFFKFASRTFGTPKRLKPNDLKFPVGYEFMSPACTRCRGPF